MTEAAGRPRFGHVAIGAGLAAGAVDIVNAWLFWYLRAGATPGRINQSIAAGLLGKDSFEGGFATAALGLALHFAISLAMAAVFWLACTRWPVLYRRPVPSGLLYGAITWVAMNLVVVPLSRATPPPFIAAWFVDGVLVHLVLFGLLLAYVARWSAGRAAHMEK